MPRFDVLVECPVYDSFRVQQVAGMFDVPIAKRAQQTFSGEVPGLDEDWQIGVIVGPSGSGKSTIARKAFDSALYEGAGWSDSAAIVDCFGDSSMKQISHLLTAVGFSSPPSWIKPYHVLSNGEKFRCDLARALICPGELVAFDEFTSVVDRTVAKIGSAAVGKAIRSGKIQKRFVAVACHYDIVDWLEPDWVLDMASGTLTRGRLRRPTIDLEVVRCHSSAWQLFKHHHYLTASLNKSAVCFMGLIDGMPAAFDAWLPFVGALKTKQLARRGHRTVVLPDFQGVGIGGKLFSHNASLWSALGYRAFSCTAHPAEIRSRATSGIWRMTRAPGRTARDTGSRADTALSKARASNRITASFEYIGPKMDRTLAQKLVER